MLNWYGQDEDGKGWLELKSELTVERDVLLNMRPDNNNELEWSFNDKTSRFMIRLIAKPGLLTNDKTGLPNYTSWNMADLQTASAERNIKIGKGDSKTDLVIKLQRSHDLETAVKKASE